MAPHHIRRYQDHDWKAVRELFSNGLVDNLHSEFWEFIKEPRRLLLLLGIPFALVLGSGSLLLSLLSFLGLLAFHWYIFRYYVLDYIDKSCHDDLLDIQKSYLSGPGSGFWVAESEHQIVGIVGGRPSTTPVQGGNYLELLRLSVKKSYRGKGLATALVQTVIQFACDQGYDGVVLVTSCFNYTAQGLYDRCGFRKIQKIFYKLKWMQGVLPLWFYQYDFSKSKE